MILLQYLIIIFAAFLIARTLVSFQYHKLDLKKTIFWTIAWIILLIIGILPEVMGVPAAILGIGRSVDVFVYVSIIVLFYIVFLLYNRTENQRGRITKLTRIIAIQQAETEALMIEQANKTVKKIISRKTKKKVVKKPVKKTKDKSFGYSSKLNKTKAKSRKKK